MKVTACGIPRSGSTLIWQIVGHVFSGRKDVELALTHPDSYEMDDSFVITSIRNPYDVAASRFRLRQVRSTVDGKGVADKSALQNELNVMKTHWDGLDRVMKARPVTILRYEEFWNNYEVIYDALEKALTIAIPRELRRTISDEYCLEKNRERSSGTDMKLMSRYRLCPGHVGMPIPGMWRAMIPPWGREMVEHICKPIAEKWGY